MKTSNKLSLFSVIISIIAIFISSWIAVWTFYVNEPYLVPRNPKLRVFLDKDDNYFGQFEFGDNRSVRTTSICFVNEGRGITGHIWAHWSYGKSWLAPSSINIANIEGGYGECKEISIRASSCNVNEPECDYKSIVPLGNQNFHLIVNCKYCEEPIMNVSISVCIWQNISSECES